MNADNNYKGMRSGFATVTTLFFMWGFITVSIDPLIAALKALFALNYAQAMLTQFAFFTAYFVVSLPAAALIARLGNSKSIMFALGVMVVGCLVVPAATYFETYSLVLVALFVVASGITILQVVANPLAAALGPPERSHFRLTFSQAFNSFGTWLAPRLVSGVILAGGIFAVTHGAEVTPELRAESFRKIDLVFLLIAGALVLLALFIFVFRRLLDVTKPVDAGQRPSVTGALKSRWALFGGLAIFLYVGAEVSIGSAMTNFLAEPDMLNIPLEQAGKMVSYLLGRRDGRPHHWQRPAVPRQAARTLAARGVCSRRCHPVSRGHAAPRLDRRIPGPVDRAVQLDHVPGHFHADAGAFECRAGGHVGPAVPRHRRRRHPAVSSTG